MRKVLLFEPWHLGDVAVALSAIKSLTSLNIEFSLVCNSKWKDWASSTGLVKNVFDLTCPWTFRQNIDKYNPFNYNLKDIIRFKKDIFNYSPDMIIDLRGDIRAKVFLKTLFGYRIKIKSSNLNSTESVYKRNQVIANEFNILVEKEDFNLPLKVNGNTITLFFGASDYNRMVPLPKRNEILLKLHEEGFKLNLILQPSDSLSEIKKFKVKYSLENLHLLKGSIQQIVNEINKSAVLVSTDSGWLHIAYFYNIPTIGLFGFDTMQTWLPPNSSVLTSNVVYPAAYRYNNKYKLLQPLSSLKVDNLIIQLNMMK